MKYTKDQQVRHVVEGLALGVLANDIEAVTSAKMTQEFAFNAAWRRWPKSGAFPSIRGHDPGNQIWIGVNKSERRRMARAAWSRDQWSWPYITMENWTVQDCLELHADERASIPDWIELGRLYVERFKDDEKRTSTA